MLIRLFLLALLLFNCCILSAAPDASQEAAAQSKLRVNNRILFQVNGKSISTLDVKKKLDIIFHREYPQYAGNDMARWDFYRNSWFECLQQLIDRELVLTDADERKVPITDGDVRQELQDVFGPNVVETIDQMGISYNEAWQLMRDEMIVSRMLLYIVNFKARDDVSPQDVSNAYDRMLREKDNADIWGYQVLTLRGDDKEKTENAAKLLYNQLSAKAITLDEATAWAEQNGSIDPTQIKISLSPLFNNPTKQLSPEYLDILRPLAVGSYSPPIFQASKSSKQPLYRIFFLKEHEIPKIGSFTDMEAEIKEALIGQAMAKRSEAYIKKLRAQYKVSEEAIRKQLPEHFEPFTLY